MSGQRISVVIRAKNEDRWLGACLNAVVHQDWPDIEMIVVDNHSTDRTREIATAYGARLVDISDADFNFSRALNWGIKEATGDLVAIVSGHCVPVNHRWLAAMAMHFREPDVVAVYGRQEPLPDSRPTDKRDLWISFGLDRKEQRRDYFFHNANSMIHRSAWERMPFNENIHGVEDQDWAKKVLRDGARIVYEPAARVFHHHGIHHGQSEERAARVVRVLELIKQDLT